MCNLQSLATTDEKVSKMMDQLTRRDDALVKTFLDVLEIDNQKHVTDFILDSHNSADVDGVIQQDMSAVQVAADAAAGQESNSCENNGETEVKNSYLADRVFDVHNHSNRSVGNCQADLLDNQVNTKRSFEVSQTEVKRKLVNVCVHSRTSSPTCVNSAATNADLPVSVVDMDCCRSVQGGNSFISETACKDVVVNTQNSYDFVSDATACKIAENARDRARWISETAPKVVSYGDGSVSETDFKRLAETGDLASETACKFVGTSTSVAGSITPVADRMDVVDGDREFAAHDRRQATGPEVNEIELREYQNELARPGVAGRNLIICAPTGSGKTFTAGHICKERRAQASATFSLKLESGPSPFFFFSRSFPLILFYIFFLFPPRQGLGVAPAICF